MTKRAITWCIQQDYCNFGHFYKLWLNLERMNGWGGLIIARSLGIGLYCWYMYINLIRHDCGDFLVDWMYVKGKMIGIDYFFWLFIVIGFEFAAEKLVVFEVSREMDGHPNFNLDLEMESDDDNSLSITQESRSNEYDGLPNNIGENVDLEGLFKGAWSY